MLKTLYKPEYFFNPQQLLSRMGFYFFPPKPQMQEIKLIWGKKIIANPTQTIGKSLFTFGLYDLALSEMISRLVKPGDLVLDVGANVGYTTRLMLDCLKGSGEIYSFEPLPELFEILKQNSQCNGNEKIHSMNMALSSEAGEAELIIPELYASNDGIATLESTAKGRKVRVKKETLDNIISGRKVKLIKIDVEGHELSVLKGAKETIKNNLVDYFLYEDLSGGQGEVTDFFKSSGYHVYKLVKGFRGLMLKDPDFVVEYSYDPDNLIATKDSRLVDEINNKQTWKIFSGL